VSFVPAVIGFGASVFTTLRSASGGVTPEGPMRTNATGPLRPVITVSTLVPSRLPRLITLPPNSAQYILPEPSSAMPAGRPRLVTRASILVPSTLARLITLACCSVQYILVGASAWAAPGSAKFAT